MWVLLAGSILAAAVILERTAVYLYYGLRPDAWFEHLLGTIRAGRVNDAIADAARCRHPVARTVHAYLVNRHRDPRLRLEIVKRTGSLTLEHVESRLRVLAAIAHLAPLVGLLGTVVGMVVAFAQIQSMEGSAKPADLAGGIWEALLTTVFGLLVAIPAMAAFHAFESHADKIARRMELSVAALDDVLDQASPVPEIGSAPAKEDWSTVS